MTVMMFDHFGKSVKCHESPALVANIANTVGVNHFPTEIFFLNLETTVLLALNSSLKQVEMCLSERTLRNYHKLVW